LLLFYITNTTMQLMLGSFFSSMLDPEEGWTEVLIFLLTVAIYKLFFVHGRVAIRQKSANSTRTDHSTQPLRGIADNSCMYTKEMLLMARAAVQNSSELSEEGHGEESLQRLCPNALPTALRLARQKHRLPQGRIMQDSAPLDCTIQPDTPPIPSLECNQNEGRMEQDCGMWQEAYSRDDHWGAGWHKWSGVSKCGKVCEWWQYTGRGWSEQEEWGNMDEPHLDITSPSSDSTKSGYFDGVANVAQVGCLGQDLQTEVSSQEFCNVTSAVEDSKDMTDEIAANVTEIAIEVCSANSEVPSAFAPKWRAARAAQRREPSTPQDSNGKHVQDDLSKTDGAIQGQTLTASDPWYLWMCNRSAQHHPSNDSLGEDLWKTYRAGVLQRGERVADITCPDGEAKISNCCDEMKEPMADAAIRTQSSAGTTPTPCGRVGATEFCDTLHTSVLGARLM
jgi:hypothetical protein